MVFSKGYHRYMFLSLLAHVLLGLLVGMFLGKSEPGEAEEPLRLVLQTRPVSTETQGPITLAQYRPYSPERVEFEQRQPRNREGRRTHFLREGGPPITENLRPANRRELAPTPTAGENSRVLPVLDGGRGLTPGIEAPMALPGKEESTISHGKMGEEELTPVGMEGQPVDLPSVGREEGSPGPALEEMVTVLEVKELGEFHGDRGSAPSPSPLLDDGPRVSLQLVGEDRSFLEVAPLFTPEAPPVSQGALVAEPMAPGMLRANGPLEVRPLVTPPVSFGQQAPAQSDETGPELGPRLPARQEEPKGTSQGVPPGPVIGGNQNGKIPGESREVIVLKTVEPVYPARARRRGVEGVVGILVEVAADGRVEKVSIGTSSGWADLDGAAVEAVAQWMFVPALQEGQPIPGQLEVMVEFRLE
ncbi:MAG: energy transducer TonB [Limnochordia bacterium]|jgi:protein TonB